MSRKGDAERQIVIAPDSGTGDLEGIAGELTISVRDGRHLYELRYSLPEMD